jgi:hypothetical protein
MNFLFTFPIEVMENRYEKIFYNFSCLWGKFFKKYKKEEKEILEVKRNRKHLCDF